MQAYRADGQPATEGERAGDDDAPATASRAPIADDDEEDVEGGREVEESGDVVASAAPSPAGDDDNAPQASPSASAVSHLPPPQIEGGAVGASSAPSEAEGEVGDCDDGGDGGDADEALEDESAEIEQTATASGDSEGESDSTDSIDNEALLAQVTVGSMLEILWPADVEFHACVVTDRDESSTIHTLRYTDGHVETIDLTWEIFRIRGGRGDETEESSMRPLVSSEDEAVREETGSMHSPSTDAPQVESRSPLLLSTIPKPSDDGNEGADGAAGGESAENRESEGYRLFEIDQALALAAIDADADPPAPTAGSVVGAEAAEISIDEGAELMARLADHQSNGEDDEAGDIEAGIAAVDPVMTAAGVFPDIVPGEADEAEGLGDSDSPDTINNEALLDQVAVGSRLEVYWPVDGEYHPCTVVGRDSTGATHTLRYADGSVERIDVTWEKFRLLVDEGEGADAGDESDTGVDVTDNDVVEPSFDNEALLPRVSLDARLEVYWRADGRYHPCVVTERDSSGRIHTLQYANGLVESIDLTWEIFRLGDDERSSPGHDLMEGTDEGSLPAVARAGQGEIALAGATGNRDGSEVISSEAMLVPTAATATATARTDEGSVADSGVHDMTVTGAILPLTEEHSAGVEDTPLRRRRVVTFADNIEVGTGTEEAGAVTDRAIVTLEADSANDSDSLDSIDNQALLAQVTVGSRLEVYWPVDGKYHPCTVVGQDLMGMVHTLRYTDGSVERIDMTWEIFRLTEALEGGGTFEGKSEVAGARPLGQMPLDRDLPSSSTGQQGDCSLEGGGMHDDATGEIHPHATGYDAVPGVRPPAPSTLNYPDAAEAFAIARMTSEELPVEGGSSEEGLVGQDTATAPGIHPSAEADVDGLVGAESDVAEFELLRSDEEGDASARRLRAVTFSDDIEGGTTTLETHSAGGGDSDEADDSDSTGAIDNEALLAQVAVGSRLEVYWPVDGEYHPCTVVGRDSLGVTHTLQYADGSVERIDMTWEKFRLRGDDEGLDSDAGDESDTGVDVTDDDMVEPSVDNEALLSRVSLNSRLEVYWRADGQYHSCIVTERDSAGRIHTLQYENDLSERIDLTWEIFRLGEDNDGAGKALLGDVGSEADSGSLAASNVRSTQLGTAGKEPGLTSNHPSEAEGNAPGGDNKPDTTTAAAAAGASSRREGKVAISPPTPKEKVPAEPELASIGGQRGALYVPGGTIMNEGVKAGVRNVTEPLVPDSYEQDEEMGNGDNDGNSNDNRIDATAEPPMPWWQQKRTKVFFDILAIIVVISLVALLARFLNNGEDEKPPGDIEVNTSAPSPSQRTNYLASPTALPITRPTSRPSSLQVKVLSKPLIPTQDMTTESPSISAAIATEPSEAFSSKPSASHYPNTVIPALSRFPSSISTDSSSPSKLSIPSQNGMSISPPGPTLPIQESPPPRRSPSQDSFLQELI